MAKKSDVAPGSTPKSKSRTRLIATVAFLVLGSGAAGGWYWMGFSGSSQHAAAESAPPSEAAEHGETRPSHESESVIALDPLLVNLADRDAARFLRVSVHLVVDRPSAPEEFKKDELMRSRVRSAVLEVLTTQIASQVVTPEGKDALKQAIAERTSSLLSPAKVTDVLFSDFVVQF